MAKTLKIIVIGAGVGGLALAQALRKSGITVEVYERDASPTSRATGYRLSISPTGGEALRACLPEDVFDLFARESARSVRSVTFLDHHLRTLLAFQRPVSDRNSPNAERPIARAALRRVLLTGLDEVVHFGKRLIACEQTEAEATARFEDGSSVRGDLIVGADGANSPTRRVLLPGDAREDLGIVAFGGKVPLNATSQMAVPATILNGPTMIMGPRGRFMFATAIEYDDLFDGVLREEYAMWGVSAPRLQLPLPTDLRRLDDRAIRAAALSVVSGWDERLRGLVGAVDLGSLSAFAIRAATEPKPWTTGRITLLGDAIHNMPPYRGVGANVALWDAALLSETLARVARDGAPLREVLGAYERRMLANGFAAVRRSVAAARRFHSESAVGRTLTKAMFRALGLAAPLRETVLGGR